MKTNQILVSLVFLFSSFLISAQDKYEFMIIEYSTIDNKVSVSIDGKEFLKEKVDYTKHNESGYNANPLLEKVKLYQEKDWEVMSFNTQLGGTATATSDEVYFAYLRKKISK